MLSMDSKSQVQRRRLYFTAAVERGVRLLATLLRRMVTKSKCIYHAQIIYTQYTDDPFSA